MAFESTGFRSQLWEANMSSHTEEFWSNETDMSVDDYRDIYSPTPVGLSSPVNEVIVLPLAFIANLFIHELRSR